MDHCYLSSPTSATHLEYGKKIPMAKAACTQESASICLGTSGERKHLSWQLYLSFFQNLE